MAGSIVIAIGACLLAPFSTSASTAGRGGGADGDGGDALSLRQLVDAARRAKAAELAQAAARLMPEPAAGERGAAIAGLSAGAGLDAPRDAPRLWMLQSVADRWRAEIVHEGRVRVIDHISAPTARLGPWRVIALREQGLLLSRAGGGPEHARTLLLRPPARGGLASGQGVVPAALSPSRPSRLPAHDALSMPTATEEDAVRRASALPSLPETPPDSPR